MAKLLVKISVVALVINGIVLVLPFVIVCLFPDSIWGQVGWVIPLLGVFVLPYTLAFFAVSFCIYKALYFYNKKKSH